MPRVHAAPKRLQGLVRTVPLVFILEHTDGECRGSLLVQSRGNLRIVGTFVSPSAVSEHADRKCQGSMPVERPLTDFRNPKRPVSALRPRPGRPPRGAREPRVPWAAVLEVGVHRVRRPRAAADPRALVRVHQK